MQVPAADIQIAAGYQLALAHLKHAQVAIDQIGDMAVGALIEMLKQICLNRVGEQGELVVEEPRSDQTPLAALDVHLLGTFQAFLNGTQINGWRKKSESLFKCLIVHRTNPIHREKLFELLWPGMDFQSARNCLNVTLHALRQSLHSNGTVTPADSFVQFVNDHYCLHPHLSVWTDNEAFTNYISLSQLALKRCNQADALTYSEIAAALYRGDFLENDCYEEWTIPHREHLKITYLTLLAQQSQLYFERSDYNAARECSRKILEYWKNQQLLSGGRPVRWGSASCTVIRWEHERGQGMVPFQQSNRVMASEIIVNSEAWMSWQTGNRSTSLSESPLKGARSV